MTLFRNPLYLIQMVSVFAYSGPASARLLVSLYALHLGAQPAEVGMLMALSFIFPMLLSWPIGIWADRFGARGLLLAGFLSGVAGMLFPFFVDRLWALSAAAALSGLSFSFSSVLVKNLVGVLSSTSDRTRNFSNASLIASLSNVIGPLIVGFVIDYSSHAMASLASAILFLVPALMVALWGGSLPGGTAKRATRPQNSLRELLADRRILAVILIGATIQMGHELFMLYMPIYGHGIGLSASVIGIILASYAIALSAIRIILPRVVKRLGEKRALSMAFTVATVGFLILPLLENPWVLCLIAFGFGLGFGCGMPITMMLIFASSPEGRSGEAVGLRETVNSAVRFVAPIVFGAIASAVGLFPVFLLSALIMGASGAVLRQKAQR